MPNKQTAIQANMPAPRTKRAIDIQADKPIPPWEQPGCFRLDREPPRASLLPLLLWSDHLSWIPATIVLVLLVPLLIVFLIPVVRLFRGF